MNTCRSCKAEVVFVNSRKTHKPMILNAEPAKGVVVQNSTTGVYGGRVDPEFAEPLEASVVDVYTDHHVTCPNADEWKGKHR